MCDCVRSRSVLRVTMATAKDASTVLPSSQLPPHEEVSCVSVPCFYCHASAGGSCTWFATLASVSNTMSQRNAYRIEDDRPGRGRVPHEATAGYGLVRLSRFSGSAGVHGDRAFWSIRPAASLMSQAYRRQLVYNPARHQMTGNPNVWTTTAQQDRDHHEQGQAGKPRVVVELENRGVAPYYYDWPIEFG